jgi:hypothetical protein
VAAAVLAHLAVGLLVLVEAAQAAQQVHQELQTRAAVVVGILLELLVQVVQAWSSSRYLMFSVQHFLAVLLTLYCLQAHT